MLKAKLVKKRQIDRYASAGRVHYWGYAPQYLRARVVSPLSDPIFFFVKTGHNKQDSSLQKVIIIFPESSIYLGNFQSLKKKKYQSLVF